MKKAYSSRIYPNKNQEGKLNRTLISCRHFYNGSLEERKRQVELNRFKYVKVVVIKCFRRESGELIGMS